MKKIIVYLIIVVIMFMSCQSTKTAVYDHYSYQQTIAIKVMTINLIEQSNQSYGIHKNEVSQLLFEVQKMVEYEKNKPNNETTTQMWQLLKDTDKHLLAGYFRHWEQNDNCSPIFIAEAKKQLNEAFDLLIQYEIKKDKQSKDNLVTLINN